MASRLGLDTNRFAIHRDGASVVLETTSQMPALAQTSLRRFEVLPSRRKILLLLNSFQRRLLACLADVLIIVKYY
jgi:hypothetical protein